MPLNCLECSVAMIEYPDDPHYDTSAYTIWGGNVLCKRHFLHRVVEHFWSVDATAAARAQTMVDAVYAERRERVGG